MDINFILNGYIFLIIKKFNLHCLNDKDINIIRYSVHLDAIAFTAKDPAAKGDVSFVALNYTSFFAVLSYRVASYIYALGLHGDAKIISEYAKVKTGIEIHPACKIGKSFVIDHGIGTVIGETVIIGNDCYLLQSVILGAARIANNKKGQRHPILGNNVEIAGFVKILACIVIGNNVKISPGMIIKNSIPDNSIVTGHTVYELTQQRKL